jgi:alpha-L-rhamnosidase
MDILSKQSQQSQLISEIQDYFYYMAERTGTLWENVHSQASCNHGFASYIGHVLYRDVLGVSNIDYLNKEITIRFSDIDLESCRGTIPVKEEVINLEWRRTGDEIQYLLQVPKGYKVHIDNRSTAKLTKMNKK